MILKKKKEKTISQLNRISQANINYLKDVKDVKSPKPSGSAELAGLWAMSSLTPILESYHRIPFHR